MAEEININKVLENITKAKEYLNEANNQLTSAQVLTNCAESNQLTHEENYENEKAEIIKTVDEVHELATKIIDSCMDEWTLDMRIYSIQMLTRGLLDKLTK